MRFPMYIKATSIKRNDKIGGRIVAVAYSTDNITGIQFMNQEMKFFSNNERVLIWR
jgi:hypothetical protein